MQHQQQAQKKLSIMQSMLLLRLLFVFIIDPAVNKYRLQVAAYPKQEPLQQRQQ